MKDLEDRILALETYARDVDDDLRELRGAHVRLSAEHFALSNMFMAMISAIHADAGAVRRAALTAFDIANAVMERDETGPEFQQAARAMLNELSAVLIGAYGGDGPEGGSDVSQPPHPKP